MPPSHKFSIFFVFIDLLVYSKCKLNDKLNDILVNSGPQLQISVEWKQNIYDLFQMWHTNESRNLCQISPTMTSSAFNNNLTFRYFCINSKIILHYNFCVYKKYNIFVVPRGGNVTYIGDPTVGEIDIWKPENENFPWVALYIFCSELSDQKLIPFPRGRS